MATYPALEVRATSTDLVLALVDDFSPAAIDDIDDGLRVFFTTRSARDAAATALRHARYNVRSLDVDDEDWARRSQENLAPVTVGRITVTPPWAAPGTLPPDTAPARGTAHPAPRTPHLARRTPHLAPRTVVISPSMGFGTGHHATTRLCLQALQTLVLGGRSVLDVGTGSGVLAIAAVKLGAACALGIDTDSDAVQSARENLELNADEAYGVEFRIANLMVDDLPAADVVVANLTGALLARAARRLTGIVRPGGTLIVSGLLVEERAQVVGAFERRPDREAREDEWLAMVFTLHPGSPGLV